MSTIKEILEDEKTNTGLIRLYREGLFYKAYERSAYLWTQAVCRYEVKVRHVKAVGADVLSIGFPIAVLGRKLDGLGYSMDGGIVTVDAGDRITFDESAYRQWRDECRSRVAETAAASPSAAVEQCACSRDTVIGRINGFPIESSSPIECMVFLSELKRQCQMLMRDGDIH